MTLVLALTLAVAGAASASVAPAASHAPAAVYFHEAQVFGRPDSGGEPLAAFGSAVAISGDTAVVGAPLANATGGFRPDAGLAYVFVRSGNTWTQQQQLMASDAAAGDQFGASVSISGDTIVIGAVRGDATAGANTGSAYVFVRTGTVWTQQQELEASDAAPLDGFGGSVSISGDVVVVGAREDDTANGVDAGSAYVFARSGVVWTEEQKLVAADGAADDLFGFSVAVSGDTALVGAFRHDSPAPDAGSVYVFVRAGATWSLEQKLAASDAADGDQFGYSVALIAGTAVIGAAFDDNSFLSDSGSAYVFVRGASWTQLQKLVAADVQASALFGSSVSIFGGLFVVGAPLYSTAGNSQAGAAYVFVSSGPSWSQEQRITAADGAAGDLFGTSVAIWGTTIVSGSPSDDTAIGADVGSAYVYTRDIGGSQWSEQQKLLSAEDANELDHFGVAIALSGDTVVVGAGGDDIPGAQDAGSASVFVRSGTAWVLQQKLRAPDGAPGDLFGASVALSGDTIVVGAPSDDGTAGDDGSAYVFVRSGTTWTLQQKLLAPDAGQSDAFGLSVTIAGDTVAVGAPWDNLALPGGSDAGSVYVFVRSGTAWTLQQKLTASDGSTGDWLGHSVSLEADTLVVGAPRTDTSGSDSGSVYVFGRSGSTWAEQQKLLASDGTFDDWFGGAVSLSADTFIAGARFDGTAARPGHGSAYVFVRSGGSWSQQQKLTASPTVAGDLFGTSVSIAGDVATVGAPATSGGARPGSVYVFDRNGVTWSENQQVHAPDLSAGDEFGSSVSTTGVRLAVGAQWDTTPGGLGAGSAHVFRESLAGVDVEALLFDMFDPVTRGTTLRYSVTIINHGPGPAGGVQAALPTPPGLAFVSNTGSCTTPFPCALGTIAAGGSAGIDATFAVPPDYSGPNPIVGTVTVTTTSTDTDPANNQASAETTVGPDQADLAAAKLGPSAIGPGMDVVYSITIGNAGPSNAAAVMVDDPTPAGLVFVSTSGACTTPFPCAVGALAVGQSRVITATFHVPNGYGGSSIINVATVTAATADPEPGDNAGWAMTTFVPPDLEPSALAVDAGGNGVFEPNESVVVAPTWRNAGVFDVTNAAGEAESFFGPPGADYFILDSAAVYASIPAGATASCGNDCYVLENATTGRPAPHWDAILRETVSADPSPTLWTLHIGGSFDDVPTSNPFYRFVETIFHRGVTTGCAPASYCAATATTRAQMAVFVLVAKEGPGYAPPACASPVFADVPATSPFCPWIEELARRGVAGGCGGGNYCPASPVTREQMAVFVLRTLDPALDPPACTSPAMFIDVPATSPFCRWVEELARRGVVTGCGGGNYCPASPVTREQMAVFLAVTFGLTLYGP